MKFTEMRWPAYNLFSVYQTKWAPGLHIYLKQQNAALTFGNAIYLARSLCPPIPVWRSTALLIMHSQYGYRDPWWGNSSNPDYERNISSLLAKFRSYSETTPEDELPLIIHVQLKPMAFDSPLYPGKVDPYGANGEEKNGMDPRMFGPTGAEARRL